MIREYRLVIEAAGHDEEGAIQSAIRMLIAGANFDEVTVLNEIPERGGPDFQRE